MDGVGFAPSLSRRYRGLPHRESLLISGAKVAKFQIRSKDFAKYFVVSNVI